jgi:O-antigen ligase
MALSLETLSPYRDSRFSIGRGAQVGAVVVIAFAALMVLDSPSRIMEVAPVLIVGLLLIVWCTRIAAAYPLWLVFALVLEETLPYSNLIPVNPESRWWLRYPLLLALCVPAVPTLWRSQLMRRGGFNLFLYYFAWAGLTIFWSLTPVVSAGRLLPDILLFVALLRVVDSTQERSDEAHVFWNFLLGCGVLLAMVAVTAFAFPVHVFRQGEDPPIGVYNWTIDQVGVMRFSGIFNAPNEIGGLVLAAAGSAFCWLCSSEASTRQRVAVLCLVGMGVLFAAMADSRSTLGVMLVGIGGYIVWRYRARGAALVIVLIVAATISVLLVGGTDNPYLGRDLTTLTGRTEAWQFETAKLWANPVLGYGFNAEGTIFDDRYFPLWDIFWNRGANTPLHNGYLSVAIGLGLPALLFWIFIFVRPWFALFNQRDDEWNLKPVFFFVALPMLLLGVVETGVGEPRNPKGLLLFLCWMLAERQRLTLREESIPAQPSSAERLLRLVNNAAAVLLVATLVGLGVVRAT